MGKKITFFFLLVIFPLFSAFSSQTTWFSPNKTEFLDDPNMYRNWDLSRKKINVFKFYSNVIMVSTDASLKKKFEYLKKNHIKIAIELPALTWKNAGLGYNIEGFQSPDFTSILLKKILNTKVNVDFLIMDEPITYGAYNRGYNSPNYTSMELAEKTYNNLNKFYKYYPDLKIGLVEAFNTMPGSFYSDYLISFLNDFNNISVKKISEVQVDQYWDGDWKTPLLFLNSIKNKFKFNVDLIFNASVKNNSDDDLWIDSAKNNIIKFHCSNLPRPDGYVFQTWNPAPKISVDDSSHLSLSYLVIFNSVLKNKISCDKLRAS